MPALCALHCMEITAELRYECRSMSQFAYAESRFRGKKRYVFSCSAVFASSSHTGDSGDNESLGLFLDLVGC
jgi:hypothetical protein